MVREISKAISNSIEEFVGYERKGGNKIIISRIYELLTLYKIEVGDELLKLFKSSYDTIDQFIKETEDKNTFDFVVETPEKRFSESTFEKIFANRLVKQGLKFDSNVVLRGNEYDIIVKGKIKEKYCPLADVDIFSSSPS
jgi:hypothetical protein